MFKSQLIIEFKHIKDEGDKREVVKTLDGLRNFYQQHPNVRTLLFAIFVEKDVSLDEAKWEADYTYEQFVPSVKTVVIRNT